MKIGYLFVLLSIAACRKTDSYSQQRYQGGPKHAAIDISAFPSPNAYDLRKPVEGILKERLDSTTRSIVAKTGMTGLTAAVLTSGQGLWQLDTGFVSKATHQPVDTSTIFYWASVSKLLTGTVIDQLIREHRLKENDLLSQWFPQFRDARHITIRALLTHTSGLYSFNEDSANILPSRFYSPEDLIGLVLARKNHFPPGSHWMYSNTNYLLLALIAEKIEHQSFAQIIHARIAEPLGLHSLRALEPHEHPDHLALAHIKDSTVNGDFSVPLGAGNVISNAHDMVLLLHALMTGQMGSVADMHNRLTDLYPMYDKGTYYGSGVMIYDFQEINHTPEIWIGHAGGTQTYRALLVYDVRTKAILALSINEHISVEALAVQLLMQVRKSM